MLAKGPDRVRAAHGRAGHVPPVTTLPTASPTNTEHHLGVVRWLRRTARVFHPLHFVRTCWRMRLLTALAVCALVAGPWVFPGGVRTEGSLAVLLGAQCEPCSEYDGRPPRIIAAVLSDHAAGGHVSLVRADDPAAAVVAKTG